MSANQIFDLSNLIAVVGWISLIAGAAPLPNQRIRFYALTLGGRVIPILLSAVYLWLVIQYWGSAPNGGYGSLEQVSVLFGSSGNLLTGWIHFLAFDLFIGRWIVDEVDRSNASRWRLLLCLPLTFLIGPAGLVAHFLLTQIVNKPSMQRA